MASIPEPNERRTATRQQHFVPQHYLKQFGFPDTKLISLARIDPYLYVSRAGISDQCQEDYFYGDDGKLEALLGIGETDIAPVLRDVCQKMHFDDKELGALRMLAVLLFARTRKAVETAKLHPKKVFSDWVEHGIATGQLPQPQGGWTPEMADFDGVAKMLIGETIPCWFEMLTLKCKILRAPPNTAFVTSDHPVLTLNQFAEGAHPFRNFVGFAKAGFQLLLPIAPPLCLYFYDEKTYKAGTRHGDLIALTPQDVETINALQIQSADVCIYFNDSVPEHKATRKSGSP